MFDFLLRDIDIQYHLQPQIRTQTVDNSNILYAVIGVGLAILIAVVVVGLLVLKKK